MGDFEIHPVGTAERIKRLERELEVYRPMFLYALSKFMLIPENTAGTDTETHTVAGVKNDMHG